MAFPSHRCNDYIAMTWLSDYCLSQQGEKCEGDIGIKVERPSHLLHIVILSFDAT